MQITDKIELTNECNMELMARYPDNYFSLAICDPPYGIGVSNNKKMTSNSKKEYSIKNWDEAIPTKEYFNELKRVSINQIIWGVNYFDGFGLNGGRIIWNKLGKDIGRRNPMPNLSDCEIAYCSMRTNIKMFSYTQIGNVYGNDYQIDWNQNRIHPTQKPPQLYKWILDKYAKENDKILDTHLGSMSIAIACADYGFELVGCELDPDYYNAGIKRIKNHISQQKLF